MVSHGVEKLMHKPAADWPSRKRSALMVVASSIAEVAFRAGLTLAGGVWQEDYTADVNGQPLSNLVNDGMRGSQRAYGIFMIFNTIAYDVRGVLSEVMEISVLTWLTLKGVVS
ncbi:UNVERIFIED_CONTAM: hypothetical protein Sindi_2229000 [Sesamum indicum]